MPLHTKHTPTDLPQSPLSNALFDVFPHGSVNYMCSDVFFPFFFLFFQKLSRDQTLRVRVWQKRPAGTPKRTCWLDPARMTPTCLSHSMILLPVVTTHSASLKVRSHCLFLLFVWFLDIWKNLWLDVFRWHVRSWILLGIYLFASCPLPSPSSSLSDSHFLTMVSNVGCFLPLKRL